jgi:hypothetical protein
VVPTFHLISKGDVFLRIFIYASNQRFIIPVKDVAAEDRELMEQCVDN